jgi:hypothetical protein
MMASVPPQLQTTAQLLEEEQATDQHMISLVRLRQEELREVPGELPRSVLLLVAAERQLPQFTALQRRIRHEVLLGANGSSLCEDAAASLTLRRVRRQRLPRELREAERLDKKRQGDTEARRKRRREDFLAQVRIVQPENTMHKFSPAVLIHQSHMFRYGLFCNPTRPHSQALLLPANREILRVPPHSLGSSSRITTSSKPSIVTHAVWARSYAKACSLTLTTRQGAALHLLLAAHLLALAFTLPRGTLAPVIAASHWPRP